MMPTRKLHRRPAGQSDGSDSLSAIVAADRAFPAAVAGRWAESCAVLQIHDNFGLGSVLHRLL
jgi:hypothetical protein